VKILNIILLNIKKIPIPIGIHLLDELVAGSIDLYAAKFAKIHSINFIGQFFKFCNMFTICYNIVQMLTIFANCSQNRGGGFYFVVQISCLLGVLAHHKYLVTSVISRFQNLCYSKYVVFDIKMVTSICSF
jgi:hypothetical protein